jgi:hypothetical protein
MPDRFPTQPEYFRNSIDSENADAVLIAVPNREEGSAACAHSQTPSSRMRPARAFVSNLRKV